MVKTSTKKKGASVLACQCGGDFTPTYKRDLLGKFEYWYDCNKCDRARKMTQDGSKSTLELYKGGVLQDSMKWHEFVKLKPKTRYI